MSQTSQGEENGQSSVDAGEISSSTAAEVPMEKNEENVSRDNSCDGRVAVIKCGRYRESVEMGKYFVIGLFVSLYDIID